MADKKNEDPKTEEKPVGIDKAGVLKLLRDRKLKSSDARAFPNGTFCLLRIWATASSS